MRFAYGVNAAQGNPVDPSVQFYRGRSATVDYIFEVDGTPVPIALAYRPPVDDSLAALQKFLDEYDAPAGFLATGDTVSREPPITRRDDRVIQLPYWFYLMFC